MNILSLNLYSYTFDNDKLNQEFLRSIKPLDIDILCFQEVDFPHSTPDILKNNLAQILVGLYPHSLTTKVFDKTKDYGRGILSDRAGKFGSEGFAVFSKYPINSNKIDYFEITKGLDRWPRAQINYNINGLNITNLHLSKYDQSREKQYPQINLSDIILGDFNTKPEQMNNLFPEYNSSYKFKSYISYPKDQTSYDYILSKLKILDVQTLDFSFSDHAGLFCSLKN